MIIESFIIIVINDLQMPTLKEQKEINFVGKLLNNKKGTKIFC
jgi:hypothetical protein